MALSQKREAKGVIADYWVITRLDYSKEQNQTRIVLSLFLNEEVRRQGMNNELTNTSFNFDGCLTVEQAYSKIKTSVIRQREVTPAVTEGSLMTGDFKVITEAVMEDYESNLFVNATDI